MFVNWWQQIRYDLKTIVSTGWHHTLIPDDYRPNLETLRVLGEPISAKRGWQDRKVIIDALPYRTVLQWRDQWEADKTSLGVVRPTNIIDMEIRPAEEEWKPKWQALFSQMLIFGPPQKPLSKLPYSFHYIFECEDSNNPHTAMCEDWELGVLFLNERARLGSDELAAKSVRDKFLVPRRIMSQRQRHPFLYGTKFPYNTWLVLGVFWPPVDTQGTLF